MSNSSEATIEHLPYAKHWLCCKMWARKGENKMVMNGAGGKNWKTGTNLRKQPGPGNLFVPLGWILSSAMQRPWGSLREGGLEQGISKGILPHPIRLPHSGETPFGLAWGNHFRPLRQNQQGPRHPQGYLLT